MSTSEQATEGVSIEAQTERLEAWAKMKGYTIVEKYIDPGYSGKDDNRPAFTRMVIDARQGKFDVIAVAMLDRLMRNLRLLLNYLYEFNELGITFVATHESLDTSTPNGKFSIQIMGVIAEFERERIGERVSEAFRHLRAQGKWPGGRPKYGYRWNAEESRFEVVEEEAEVIRLAFDLYVNHNMGTTRVVERLNMEGYRTRPRRLGRDEEAKTRSWHLSRVYALLTHKGYIGEDDYYTYPPIISRELFEAASRKLATSRRIRREPGKWLLQGRVVCGKCGHQVGARQRSDNHTRRYECLGRTKSCHTDGSPRCTLAVIPAEGLEKTVWRVFSRTLTNRDLLLQSIEDSLSLMESRQQALG